MIAWCSNCKKMCHSYLEICPECSEELQNHKETMVKLSEFSDMLEGMAFSGSGTQVVDYKQLKEAFYKTFEKELKKC